MILKFNLNITLLAICICISLHLNNKVAWMVWGMWLSLLISWPSCAAAHTAGWLPWAQQQHFKIGHWYQWPNINTIFCVRVLLLHPSKPKSDDIWIPQYCSNCPYIVLATPQQPIDNNSLKAWPTSSTEWREQGLNCKSFLHFWINPFFADARTQHCRKMFSK